MSRRRCAWRALAVLLAGGCALPAGSSPEGGAGEREGYHDIPRVRTLYERGEIRSLEALVAKARERYPGGRLIEAELLSDGERLIYEIELLDADGVLRELFYDARSGEAVPGYEEGDDDEGHGRGGAHPDTEERREDRRER